MKMQVTSFKFAKIALIKVNNLDFLGYKQILDQEKIPYDIIEGFKEGYELVIAPHGLRLNGLMKKYICK